MIGGDLHHSTLLPDDDRGACAPGFLRHLLHGFLEGSLGLLRQRLFFTGLIVHRFFLVADPKKPRGGVKPDPEQIAARKRAVELELRRKLAELDERYAVDATLEPLVLIRMSIPALAVDLSVHRKRAVRKHTVYWNAILKQLEPIRCSQCGRSTFSVAFHDEDVAPLCAECSR